MYLQMETARKRITFGKVCNVMSIRRLILADQSKKDQWVTEDGWRMLGEKERVGVKTSQRMENIFVSTSIQTALTTRGSFCPALTMPPSFPSDCTSAISCQSSADRRRPCLALIEMVPVDLTFPKCARCWFSWQVASIGDAKSNKTGLFGGKLIYRVEVWEFVPVAFKLNILFSYSVVHQLHGHDHV